MNFFGFSFKKIFKKNLIFWIFFYFLRFLGFKFAGKNIFEKFGFFEKKGFFRDFFEIFGFFEIF